MKLLQKNTTKKIMDGAIAGIITEQLPGLLNQVYPMNVNLSRVATGIIALFGSKAMKKPDVGGIVIGILLSDMLNDVIGGVTTTLSPEIIGAPQIEPGKPDKTVALQDYLPYPRLSSYRNTVGLNHSYAQYYN